MFGNAGGITSLLKDGGKHFAGVDEALLKNIEACKELSKIVQSSFGPNGTNKLVVNHLGKHFVTSDTATMLKEMEVAHPCGKLLVQASSAQEFECGDATNFCVMLAGSLLHEAECLLKEGLHAADVLKGYELALKKVLEVLDDTKTTCWTLTSEGLKNEGDVGRAVKTAISAKQYGLETELSELLAKAVVQVTRVSKFEMDNIRTAKIPGGSLSKSFVVDGMVVPRDTLGVEKKKTQAKVVVYGSGFEFQQTEAKGTVLLESAEQLLNYSKGEESNMEAWVRSLADAGISVVISGGAVSEIAMHFLDKYKILVCKIGSKFELRRICKTLKAVSIIRAGPPLPEEVGFCDSVAVEELASQKVTIFKTAESKISTIVLRGATANTLDEWERALNDGVHVIRCAAKDGRFCPGGAATETMLARELQTFGATVPGLDQYAVLKFAESLECVPKILADNCGKKGRVETITGLYKEQETQFQKSTRKTIGINVDLEDEQCLQDSLEQGVLDHLDSKKWAIKHALEAVLTVLRVDHIIMAKQAGGGK
ncbi:unnamed protein product [Amoebophrya sp. A120]|nr:unnamed protein product [Amoebophrya sp. A120]|eukprot:GSA120T00011101001.1